MEGRATVPAAALSEMAAAAAAPVVVAVAGAVTVRGAPSPYCWLEGIVSFFLWCLRARVIRRRWVPVGLVDG
ncbi:hypothetical protein DFJ73DRAFT_822172 [Zopfochytrium polystomum]|nr:hypothetical protein DFJ73DRAFT_822172 [Zopfochytrium polystomum]